jgi:hypothetical protein
MAFDLSQYETVHERLDRFWKKHDSGRVNTELIAYSDTQYIFKAEIYKDAADEKPLATGFAEERVGSTFVNKTSALENAETSAIGRALANGGFVSATKQRASVNEMQKANRYEAANGEIPKEEWKNTARGAWADVGQASDKQVNFVKSIVKDAFTSTGFQDDEKSWNYIGEWVKSVSPIAKAEDLTSKQASMIINDKMKSKSSLTKLVEFLQAKQNPEHDPWATPANF